MYARQDAPLRGGDYDIDLKHQAAAGQQARRGTGGGTLLARLALCNGAYVVIARGAASTGPRARTGGV